MSVGCCVIANSELLGQKAESYGVPRARIRVFPNGVDEELFHPRDRRAARQACRLPQERPIVAFLGQFIERKGPHRVLEAIRSRPEIGAVFLGYGPQAPTGPQVLFRGAVPHDQVPLWLCASDMLALPTLDEGCSNAILEALFCGLPVVSSDLPFNRAILDDEAAVLVDPLNPAAVRDAVFALIDDPDRRAVLGAAALRRSLSFRLADRAQRLLEHLRTLCRTSA